MRDKVLNIIKEALEELNEELEYESLNKITENTAVFSGAEGIDSLTLVLLVSTLESEIANELDVPVTLADEKVMSERNTPYKTVGTVADFIMAQMKE